MFYPRYYRIRTRMREKKIKVRDLAAMTGIPATSLSKRLNNVIVWNIDECYSVLDALEVDRRELVRYFPPENVEVEIC